MLKGHATIELTNVNTGEKQVIEEDNLVTKGFEKFFKKIGNASMPGTSSSYFLADARTYAKTLFGGIMLFNGNIEEDVNNTVFPSDCNCIGYGSEIANNSINQKCGTYNATESGAQDGSYKHVWDFATNQANGEIASVCLVPLSTARLGMGTEVKEYSSNINLSSTFNLGYLFNTTDNLPSVDCIMYFDDEFLYCVKKGNILGSEATHIKNNGGILNIEKYRYKQRTMGINSAPTDFVTPKLEETINVTLPADFVTRAGAANYNYCSYEKGYIYLYCGQSYAVKKGETMYICKINISDYSTEIIHVTNNIASGSDLRVDSLESRVLPANSRMFAIVNGKKLVARFYSGEIAIIDLHDNTYIKVTINDGATELTSNYYLVFGFSFGDYLIMSLAYSTSDGEQKLYAVNTETGKAYLINTQDCNSLLNQLYYYSPTYGSNSSYEYQHYYASYVNDEDFKICACHGDNQVVEHGIVMNPYILMTINNLTAPVTKTAEQTMKITYTLTEAGE